MVEGEGYEKGLSDWMIGDGAMSVKLALGDVCTLEFLQGFVTISYFSFVCWRSFSAPS